MKTFHLQYNIGKVKYCISYHDGIQTHKDGSRFYGIIIFKNKKLFDAKIKEMKGQGYQEKSALAVQ